MFRPAPRTCAAIITWILVSIGGATIADATTLQPAKLYVVHHVYATGKKKPDEKPKLPKVLEPYEKTLAKAPFATYSVEGSKKLDFSAKKKQTLPLPDKLGELELEEQKDGRLKFTITRTVEGKKETLGGGIYPGKPVFFVNDKLKKGAAQYMLILDLPKPSPKPGG